MDDSAREKLNNDGTPSPNARPAAAGMRAAQRRRAAAEDAALARRGTLVSALFAVLVVAAALLFITALRLGGAARPYAAAAKPAILVRPPPEAGEGLPATEVISRAGASVVSIDLYEDKSLSPGGSASGVVLSEDGYIATNAHVIHRFPLIRVVLPGGDGYTARVVGTDARCDLAVLKIDAGGLVPAEFGDSAGVQMGSRVIAIGNAAGILPGTPSQGIISGVDRQVSISTVAGEIVLLDLLQTDAAINPGSSGGALVNAWGQVIGINVAKLEDEDVENIGFAIPSSLAVPVIQRIIDEEKSVSAPRLGCAVLAVNETTGPAQGLPEYGLYITGLAAESGLPEAGAKVGDVILRANDVEMRTTGDLIRQISQMMPGDTIELLLFQCETGETVLVESVLYG